MLPRSSAWPTVLMAESSHLGDWEEEITRVNPEVDEEIADDFKERRRLVRRRPSRLQGRSLEVLGHAVEYLVDSRMFVVDAAKAKTEREAVQILMRLSRMVFLECEQTPTVWDKMTRFWERPAKGPESTTSHATGVQQL